MFSRRFLRAANILIIAEKSIFFCILRVSEIETEAQIRPDSLGYVRPMHVHPQRA